MRTAGMLLMDTPLPDGRILLPPQAVSGGGTLAESIAGVLTLTLTGNGALVSSVPLFTRYGMSDDAQQQFGMGSVGTLGYQGAQAQVVATGQPYTTPYGPTGRPPQLATNFAKTGISRPKGVKPLAATVAYSVTGGPMTSATLAFYKTVLTVGVVPAPTALLTPFNLPLANAQTNLITVPFPVNNQVWFNDFFDILGLSLIIQAGAATFTLYGIYIDVAFNYN
jgi:hypothetical protein